MRGPTGVLILRGWTAPALVAAVFAADRLTKWWALTELQVVGSIPLLPFFHLTYLENTGAAFGMGAQRNKLFIVIASVLLAVLLYLRRKWTKDNLWLQYGALLVIGGALGNLFDRISYGYVVDFLDFRVWPVFNIADSCVSVGAGFLAWGLHRDDKAASGPAPS